MALISRRQWLAGTMKTGVAVAAGMPLFSRGPSAMPVSMPIPTIRPWLPLPTLLPPGRTLVAEQVRLPFSALPGGQDGLGYNGGVPGPTIRVQNGQVFRQRVENRLTQETSFHWHGLVAPPDMDGQPAEALAPGTAKDIVFPIKQRASLNWYHPHPHGQTATQVWHGMAGFFIVNDEEESALNLPSGDQERILVLRDAQLASTGALIYPLSAAGTEGDFPLVNGVAWPRTQLGNQFARLRILNGANARVFTLTSEAPLILIGNDGGLLEKPMAVREIEMAPAERVDVLLDLRGYRAGTNVGLSCATTGWRLLDIEVVDRQATSWSIPDRLSTIERLQHDGPPDRSFVFQENEQINNLRHDMSRIDFYVPLGKVERWRFSTARGAPHPVHVHGAHFQVQSRSGGVNRGMRVWESGWKDTVHLGTHEEIDILIKFDRYEGRYLIHCHKLEHEDHGMMMNFVVARDIARAQELDKLERLYGPICTTASVS